LCAHHSISQPKITPAKKKIIKKPSFNKVWLTSDLKTVVLFIY